MSKETRTLRPFHAPAEFSNALRLAQLHMGEQVCDADSQITIGSPEDFLRAQPAVSWARDDACMVQFRALLEAGTEKCGILPSDLGLVIVASSNYLKIADTCYLRPLSKCASEARLVRLANPRPRALQASTHGAKVTTYVALLSEQEQRPLRPWRLGTWLARAEFRITVGESAMGIFRPTPLDDEKRSELQLPKQTVRYFTLGDHDPLRPFGETEPPEFFVDEDLLSRISATGESPLSKAIQSQLVCDFIASVVVACATSDTKDHEWSDLKDSLVGRIVRLVAGSKAPDHECMKALELIDRDPAKFVALAEGALNVRSAMVTPFAESP